MSTLIDPGEAEIWFAPGYRSAPEDGGNPVASTTWFSGFPR
jgi:hypothetical protein